MMKYCKSYTNLEDMRIITEVIIPLGMVGRIELYVRQLMYRYDGKCLTSVMMVGGSMRMEVSLPNDAKNKKFCDDVEKAIDEGGFNNT